jgi:hypothetical protein
LDPPYVSHLLQLLLILEATKMSSHKEKLRSGEMRVRGDQWPYFLYADEKYDPNDPWLGLLRSQLLIMVSTCLDIQPAYPQEVFQAYKHVFTSPSSVEDEEPRATRSGNARIHGMSSVTKGSIAYIATQVLL